MRARPRTRWPRNSPKFAMRPPRRARRRTRRTTLRRVRVHRPRSSRKSAICCSRPPIWPVSSMSMRRRRCASPTPSSSADFAAWNPWRRSAAQFSRSSTSRAKRGFGKRSSVANDAGAAAAARTFPELAFKHDPDLPISAQRAAIMEELHRNPVLIVAGDTGSGKSTQLPQYCLEMGRGIDGLIAHTQPRRLAARALAARIADELAQPVGATVGFRVRFADQVGAATRLVLMTDGLLLAELASDPQLTRYDTIIVDEAHERTLNVDLLLGVLKRLLPRRPDLKLIVTSATLDVERVSKFFDDAPIIAVTGRNHPIEVRYTTDADEAEDPDLPVAVLDAYRDIVTSP